MTFRKISELPEAIFNGQTIDNCFYVEKMNTPEMKVVPMRKVFAFIEDQALKSESFEIEIKEDRIIFKNQNLSSAAPDLLAACVEALRHHQGGHSEIGAQLKKAINKASGI